MSFSLAPWVLPTVLSAVMLGFYDITKKHAVNANAVMPVLFFSTLSGCVGVTLFSVFSGKTTEVFSITLLQFILIFFKSVLVAASWVCAYCAMKTLPISIASPVRASAPLWTFLGSLVLYHEIPTVIQAIGMILIFAGYYAFAVIGKLEGFSFRHKGMIFIFAGTLLGAASALYDKFLLNVLSIPHIPLQFHFALDLVLILGVAWLCRQKSSSAFVWRWSIVLTGILLVIADNLYFFALSTPDVKISILSLIRRSGCIISFLFDSWIFRDSRIKFKAAALLLILLGVALLTLKFQG